MSYFGAFRDSSGNAALTACEQTVDEEYDYCADDASKEACRFTGLVPSNGLT